ncbi:MAG: hypothetical protein IJ733_15950 [Lachnospiraceae bacterium]|nr:hypothetical protein [Lachnospiraceae bacterium]
MSTFETTVTMLNDLNDEELLSIQWIILNMKKKQGLFQPKSKEEILDRLDESKKQADAGLGKNVDIYIDELRDRYGL